MKHYKITPEMELQINWYYKVCELTYKQISEIFHIAISTVGLCIIPESSAIPKRGRITKEMKEEIFYLSNTGNQTTKQIATQLNISISSVLNYSKLKGEN